MVCTSNEQIVIPSVDRLMVGHTFRKFWLVARNLPAPEKGWIEDIGHTLGSYKGEIVLHTGQPFIVEDIADLFQQGSICFPSDVLTKDWNGLYTRAQINRGNRTRVIYAYIRIKYPALAKHIRA